MAQVLSPLYPGERRGKDVHRVAVEEVLLWKYIAYNQVGAFLPHKKFESQFRLLLVYFYIVDISEIFSKNCWNLLFALFCCFSFFVCWLFLFFNLHTLPEIWISKGKLFQSLLEKDIYFDRKILNVILEFVYCAPPHKLTIWKRYLALSFSHQLKHIKDGCSTMLWVVMVYLFCATRPMKEKQGFTFWDSFQSHKLFP